MADTMSEIEGDRYDAQGYGEMACGLIACDECVSEIRLLAHLAAHYALLAMRLEGREAEGTDG